MQVASRQIVWNAGGRGTVIEVEMTPTTGLYIKFFTEGDAEWFVDGDGTARSGGIGDDQATTLKTVVQGKGTLTFRWRTSSEGEYDWLRLRIDGDEVGRISGWRDWEEFSHVIANDGSHTVEWRYDKDGSVADGEDCGWISNVVWTPVEG